MAENRWWIPIGPLLDPDPYWNCSVYFILFYILLCQCLFCCYTVCVGLTYQMGKSSKNSFFVWSVLLLLY